MTRINVVPVSELSRQHLVAEYRELPRLFALVGKAIDRGETPRDPRNPDAYTLGKGHVRFFYSRMRYILNRNAELFDEMIFRGYNPKYAPVVALEPKFRNWMGDYLPTEEALAINRARILERS
jgi:deoxyribonuclease (pyrimidine dimer)